jgi:DNA-binding NarL/FixJ family response regulator
VPLRTQVEALARGARVSLTVIPQNPPRDTAVFAGLTAREREVLAHLLAGRTYGEIARALTVSEKTVSTHISNLLRKTGTSSRVELAQLAGRLTGPQAQ